MPALIEVKYFNTFVLKKTISSNLPVWNGSFGIPQAKGGYPAVTSATNVNNWAIEESRIRGGYNNTSVSFGAKAYLVEEEPNAVIRSNTLIYSGIFNSRTGVNNTNVFSVGVDITKSVDPANGSIQKLYAENTNLNIFQELKVSRALIDKDAIYSAEGGGTVTSANLVIGAIQPYAGKFGISKNPQSFAVHGFNKYFSDKNNNVVLKLSQNGLNEISSAGMIDYFRDRFGNQIDVSGVEGTILGGYDVYNKQYVISTQVNNVLDSSFDTNYDTVTWDELVKGWTSFFTYKPDQMLSNRNDFYSLKDGKLYKHYSQFATRNLFYSDGTPTSVGGALTATNTTSGTGYETPPSTGVRTIATTGNGKNMLVTFTQAAGIVQSNTVAIVNAGIGYAVGDTGTITTGDGAAVYTIASIKNVASPTSLTLVLNPNVSSSKNFKTVDYEGSNGWQINSFVSGFTGSDISSEANWRQYQDTTTQVYSYVEGSYDGVGNIYPDSLTLPIYYAGFKRKENKYVANLINNSETGQGEVTFGPAMSGIKGFFGVVTVSTDHFTDPGGEKELFLIGSDYSINNGY